MGSGRHCAASCAVSARCDPEPLLSFGHRPAGHERVDADPMLPEVPRHPAGQAMHRGFSRRVRGKASAGAPPGVRSEVDDRSAAGGDHTGSDGLDREEHVTQVRRDAFVEELGRDVLHRWRSSRAALLTRTRAAPWVVASAATARRSASMSRRSHGSNRTFPPSACSVAASVSPCSTSKSRNPTRDRWPAKARTISIPIPDAPPVTMTLAS